MLIELLKSKLHLATVTDTKLHYPGSMALDSKLMKAAGLLPYESVIVANVSNGNRLKTYVIPAKAGSGDVIILGAAAHLIKKRDRVIILSFGLYTPAEAKKHKPKIVILDNRNKIKSKT